MNAIPGITAVKPKAALYIFSKIDVKRCNITDDNTFALGFLRKKRVLFVPESGFNWHNLDHFRIVYLLQLPVLQEATQDLAEFLSDYKQPSNKQQRNCN